MSETRTTRIVTAIAGNAFFVNKIADVWINDHGRYHLEKGAIELAIVALIGIVSAYISLFGSSGKRWPLFLEILSALCFFTNTVCWLYISEYGRTS